MVLEKIGEKKKMIKMDKVNKSLLVGTHFKIRSIYWKCNITKIKIKENKELQLLILSRIIWMIVYQELYDTIISSEGMKQIHERD